MPKRRGGSSRRPPFFIYKVQTMTMNKDNFINLHEQFSLGKLTTESLHPYTENLSTVVNSSISDALERLVQVDLDALNELQKYSKQIYTLQKKCHEVISSGNKVFITGCGATGRLALSLEKIYQETFGSSNIIGLMAGGDFAIVRAVESFEDSEEFGHRQLIDNGFTENDLLIAITEGGETSFVIGTANYAASISKHRPYFLYCNPDEELQSIDRSNNILKNNQINKLNLTCGPMAISGSTRMQATTVQMISAGFAIMYKHNSFEEFNNALNGFVESLGSIDLDPMMELTQMEADIYHNDEYIVYETQPEIAIALLTDTTERSPTFSLDGFERSSLEPMSLCYLTLNGYEDNKKVWSDILGHEPRCIDWSDIEQKINKEELYEFDMTDKAIERRRAKESPQHIFKVELMENFSRLSFQLKDKKIYFDLMEKDLFFIHIFIKKLMNIHSTLLMGLLGRYDGNIMTYVRPSNLKLIDRSMRYITELLEREGRQVCQDQLINVFFEVLEGEEDKSSPIVYKVFEKLKSS